MVVVGGPDLAGAQALGEAGAVEHRDPVSRRKDIVMSEVKAPALPRTLVINDVPVADALVALSNRLGEIAERMDRLSDVSVDLSIRPDGACSLIFRATR